MPELELLELEDELDVEDELLELEELLGATTKPLLELEELLGVTTTPLLELDGLTTTPLDELLEELLELDELLLGVGTSGLDLFPPPLPQALREGQ